MLTETIFNFFYPNFMTFPQAGSKMLTGNSRKISRAKWNCELVVSFLGKGPQARNVGDYSIAGSFEASLWINIFKI